MNSSDRWASRLGLVILLSAFALYLCTTYRHFLRRWDDAFITFRFAQHLADGHGLIWNIGGERVEGYTSFLQVLLLALGMKLGIQPQLASVLISVVAVSLTAGMFVRLARQHWGFLHPIAAVIMALYLVDPVTAVHSTSGLETQLFVVLLCGAYLAALRFLESSTPLPAVCLSLIVFASILTRPEGVIYGGALYLILASSSLYLTCKGREASPLPHIAWSVGLLALLGLGYAIWKYGYFGYLLPNPFYVKAHQLSPEGWKYVLFFLFHLVVWYGPLAVGVGVVILKTGTSDRLQSPHMLTRMLLTLCPAILGLTYYLTIIHEMGGAHRFSYPAYFSFIAALILASAVILSRRLPRKYLAGLTVAFLAYLVLQVVLQGGLQLTPLPPNVITRYHLKIAQALKDTGLGARAMVLTDAAGVIPYTSGFNQLDRVGLTDNFLSGRRPVTLRERERYLWSRGPDVYVGYEPPATAGAQRPHEDPRTKSWYVTHLMKRKLKGIEDRIFVQDPELLHARMRELRDHWHWVGEVEWPGWQAWKLKSFIYVRKASPYADLLGFALRKIVATSPDKVSLDTEK